MNEDASFVRLCRIETEQLDQLSALLQHEQQAILLRQDNILIALANEKSQLLDQLLQSAKQRGELMAGLGLTDSQQVYAWLADKPEEREAWLALEKSINFAQSLNQLNAGFVEQQLANVQEALDVLRQAASSTLSYDRGGQQPQGLGGSRFLGSA